MNTQTTETIIPQRFCGPPKTGNGGFIAGRTAVGMKHPTISVKIKAPVPLDSQLQKIWYGETKTQIQDSEGKVLSEAVIMNSDLKLDLPAMASWDEAVHAAENYMGLSKHPFPTCFVCGPDRHSQDGMRIFCGPIQPQKDFAHLLAGGWTPDTTLVDGNGKMMEEVVWGALDCPGGFAVSVDDPRMIVLAKLTAKINRLPTIDSPCIVMAWEISRNRRSRIAGTCIYDLQSKDCLAFAEGIWMVPTQWDELNQRPT